MYLLGLNIFLLFFIFIAVAKPTSATIGPTGTVITNTSYKYCNCFIETNCAPNKEICFYGIYLMSAGLYGVQIMYIMSHPSHISMLHSLISQ